MKTSIHFVSPTNQTVAKIRYHEGESIETEKLFLLEQGWRVISASRYYQRIYVNRTRDKQLRVAYETAAMWLYGPEYASTTLSASEFYEKLPSYRKENIARMIAEIVDKLP